MPSPAEPHLEPFAWEGSTTGLFRRLASGRHPFLLMSGDPAAARGRWSVMGADPFRTWELAPDGKTDPFRAVGELLARYPTAEAPGVPFAGGLVGYLGYECLRFVERAPVRMAEPGDPPDAWFGAYATGPCR